MSFVLTPLRALAATLLVFATPAFAAIVDNGDGTLTDTATGLVWDRCTWGESWNGTACTGAPLRVTWQQALVAAGAANAVPGGYKGHADWRVPNKKELASIGDRSRYNFAIDPLFSAAFSPSYWSSTSYAQFPASAWFVTFTDASESNMLKTAPLYLRLVRGADGFDRLAPQPVPALSAPAAGGLALALMLAAAANRKDRKSGSSHRGTENTEGKKCR